MLSPVYHRVVVKIKTQIRVPLSPREHEREHAEDVVDIVKGSQSRESHIRKKSNARVGQILDKNLAYTYFGQMDK